MTPSPLKTSSTMVLILSMAALNDAFQTTACKASKTGLVTKQLLSPLKMFRDFDELFDRQLFNAGFTDFYSPPRLLFQSRPAGQKKGSSVIISSNEYSSPWYDVAEDNEKIQVAIDVPGIKASDMSVKFEQDNRVLRISGERKFEEGNLKSERQFEKAFVLQKNVDTENITAKLSDGIIVITVPKKEVVPKSILQIPIVDNPNVNSVAFVGTESDEVPSDHEGKEEEVVMEL